MSKEFTYATKGVCSRRIFFELDGTTVKNVRFEGGCHGNTQGLAALANGMQADELIKRLKGTDCRGRGTSCPDQLAKAIEEAVNEG
jgi:uncharacterized protein (TIGR03905 family)